MKRRKKLIITILLVILAGLVASIIHTLYFQSDNSIADGNKTILVCAIDEGEIRPGIGACDMAFLIQLINGNIVNYEAIYPGGLTHPTELEPEEYVSMGAGTKLLLHDAFYSSNNSQRMKLAREIVEYNTNTSIDAVVCINTAALSNILSAANPIIVDGKETNITDINIIREEQYINGNTRENAVLIILKGAIEKSKDFRVKTKLVKACINEYNKGNIIMDPPNEFIHLLATKGLNNLFH